MLRYLVVLYRTISLKVVMMFIAGYPFIPFPRPKVPESICESFRIYLKYINKTNNLNCGNIRNIIFYIIAVSTEKYFNIIFSPRILSYRIREGNSNT